MSTPASSSGKSKLGVLFSELLRAGYRVEIEPELNAWGVPAGAVVAFIPIQAEPKESGAEVQAIQNGAAPSRVMRTHFDLFDPTGLEAAVEKFHRRFVASKATAP